MKIIPLYPNSQIKETREFKQNSKNQKHTNYIFNPMKSLLITIVALALTFTLYSQDGSVYTLNGKLGLGLVPEKKLDVDGDAKLRGDVYILGDNSIQGSVVVGQSLYLPNISNATSGDIVVRGTNGIVSYIEKDRLYKYLQPTHADCAPGLDSYWKYEEGKIYSRCISGTDVGIGTSNPQHRLDVVGDMGVSTDLTVGAGLVAASNNFKVNDQGEVFCRELTITLGSFPDYVFEKDYKLMSLYDLEQYIERNKHLPNMPSSTDVAKNGGDIGEINRVLVEKVEELTLHTINQQKLVDAQQKQITSQQKLIDALTKRLDALDGNKNGKQVTPERVKK